MSRNFRTKLSNRTNYVYTDAEGKNHIVRPGEEGVTPEMIADLHAMDDDWCNAENRERYHITVRLDARIDTDSEKDGNETITAADQLDPEAIFLEKLEALEHAERIMRLRKALQQLKPEDRSLVQDVFYQGMQQKDAAAVRGVSKAAITKRLKRIYRDLGKILEEQG